MNVKVGFSSHALPCNSLGKSACRAISDMSYSFALSKQGKGMK
jgi:hypothetical protein